MGYAFSLTAELPSDKTLAWRQAYEESGCFHSSATIKTWKHIYFS